MHDDTRGTTAGSPHWAGLSAHPSGTTLGRPAGNAGAEDREGNLTRLPWANQGTAGTEASASSLIDGPAPCRPTAGDAGWHEHHRPSRRV